MNSDHIVTKKIETSLNWTNEQPALANERSFASSIDWNVEPPDDDGLFLEGVVVYLNGPEPKRWTKAREFRGILNLPSWRFVSASVNITYVFSIAILLEEW